MPTSSSVGPARKLVALPHNWRTSDADELERRRERAAAEEFRIANLDRRHPIFSNFRVGSRNGLDYSVEIRDVRSRQFACECVDFRINGLGTCKHVEAVLRQLEAVLAHGRALAVEQRLPEPAALDAAFQLPLARAWREALGPLRGFAADPNVPGDSAADALAGLGAKPAGE